MATTITLIIVGLLALGFGIWSFRFGSGKNDGKDGE